jgi:N-formylglutamate amidohydrolase
MDGFDLDAAAQPYEIRGNEGPNGMPDLPLIFASPHSGRIYPAGLMAASVLDAASIRASEDAFVDALVAGGVEVGAAVIANRFARAYVDVNREAYELDPTMFEEPLPAYAIARGPRIAAGLGSVPRVVADGQEIYGRKLAFAEAVARIEAVHAPYHAALTALVDATAARHGRAVVIDWHSMPSAAGATSRGGRLDFVLGDRFGQACDGGLTGLVEATLRDLGHRVARNSPYAGGYTTERYGRPADGVHTLQVEINRALYLDEENRAPHEGFEGLKADLAVLFETLARALKDGRL